MSGNSSNLAACHSAVYLPWLGYFYKMSLVEVFIILDNTQIMRGRGVGYRNDIKLQGKAHRLAVPIQRLNGQSMPFREVRIDYGRDWVRKHLASLAHAYGKAPYYREIMDLLEPIYAGRPERLLDLNLPIILAIRDYLGLETRFEQASELGPEYEDATVRLADLTRRAGMKGYVSGFGGSNYMNAATFADKSVECFIYRFQHPRYAQHDGEPFVSNLSTIDLLMNHGPQAAAILGRDSQGVERFAQ